MPTVAVKCQDLADCYGTGLVVSFWESHLAEKIMRFTRVASMQWCILAVCALASIRAAADDPKPTPENTIHVQVAEPVKPQTFPRPLKFFLVDVIDRSGSAQPMMVFKPRGGIFLDHTPSDITRAGLETCLKSANMLAADRDSADLLLTVYLFNFGLSDSSGMDFFGKVEFAVTLKNPNRQVATDHGVGNLDCRCRRSKEKHSEKRAGRYRAGLRRCAAESAAWCEIA